MTFTRALATNNYGPAKFIVDGTTVANGTHSTIAAALTSASSGDTIVIRPGTYTENLTLKAGVNLTAWQGDGYTPNVTIVGKATASITGNVTITGIRLQTNSDFVLLTSGSNIQTITLINCYINCTNSTGISDTNSNASSVLAIQYCDLDLTTTGIAHFNSSATGELRIAYSRMGNTGNSLTANVKSAGFLSSKFNRVGAALTYSTSSGSGLIFCDEWNLSALNITPYTSSGTNSYTISNSLIQGGTASALSIGSGTTLSLINSVINSSNTNAITGAGTLNAFNNTLSGSSVKSNVTTQTGGAANGLTQGTAPSAGFIGEQIRSFLAGASAVTLTNNIAANITSISLTAGIWDVSCVGAFQAAAITGVDFCISISTTSATRGTGGDSEIETPIPPTSSANNMLAIPSFRITLSATTTVFLVGFATFSVGTLKAFGRIAGTRVG